MKRIYKYSTNLIKSNFPFINSVLNDSQKGLVFKDKFDNYFVVNKAGFSQLIINNLNHFDVLDFANFILKSDEIPAYIHMYDVKDSFIQSFRRGEHFNLRIRERVQLRYMEKSINKEFINSLPLDYIIEEINQNNINELDLFGLKIDSKFWESKEAFLSDGYGVVIRCSNGKPVCICYSACFSNEMSEIDVYTMEKYRGNGLARVATNYYIKMSINKNVYPNWDCFTDNTPSLYTAKKCGFTEIRTYTFLSIYNKTK